MIGTGQLEKHLKTRDRETCCQLKVGTRACGFTVPGSEPSLLPSQTVWHWVEKLDRFANLYYGVVCS